MQCDAKALNMMQQRYIKHDATEIMYDIMQPACSNAETLVWLKG